MAQWNPERKLDEVRRAGHVVAFVSDLQAEITRLRKQHDALLEALDDSRDAIASLEKGALGWAIEPPRTQWPIRDELLSKIDAALAKARGA